MDLPSRGVYKNRKKRWLDKKYEPVIIYDTHTNVY